MSANQALIARGVVLPDPQSVYVAPEVSPDNIHEGAVLHPGTRLYGATTSIGPGAEIGAESAATLRDCQLAAKVKFRGGFAQGATFLEGADCGDGTHVRPGTLLEEQASVAHTNGLKQTILMPYATLGSLTNFCDVLLAGGTGPKNHSEVGSSYIHFNFTPHQDKATASICGDVPHGVFLDQPPVFLGGQGGLEGPRRIAFGTVVAAGLVGRKDILEPSRILLDNSRPRQTAAPVLRSYDPSVLGPLDGIVANNLNYIGNLAALRAWYMQVRRVFLERTPWGRACLSGALTRIREGLAERSTRLAQLFDKARADESGVNAALVAAWDATLAPRIESLAAADTALPADLDTLARKAAASEGYLAFLKTVTPAEKTAATAWLQSFVDLATAPF